MVLAEIPDPDHPAHQHAVATKTWVRQRLGDLTDEKGVTDSIELADRIALVLEGVYASVPALGAHGPARQAQALADLLLTTAQSGQHRGTGR